MPNLARDAEDERIAACRLYGMEPETPLSLPALEAWMLARALDTTYAAIMKPPKEEACKDKS